MDRIPTVPQTTVLSPQQMAETLHAANDLEHAPRSLAMSVPEHFDEFASVLESIVELPVEFHLAFDMHGKHLIVMTGERSGVVHGGLFGTGAESIVFDRSKWSPVLHNHATRHGEVKTSPSLGDWMALVASARTSGLRRGWIISAAGITFYELPESLRVDDAFVVRASDAYEKAARRCREAGVPPDDNESLSAEHFAIISDTEMELQHALSGRYEVIPWRERERIRNTMQAFVVDGKRGAWARKFAPTA